MRRFLAQSVLLVGAASASAACGGAAAHQVSAKPSAAVVSAALARRVHGRFPRALVRCRSTAAGYRCRIRSRDPLGTSVMADGASLEDFLPLLSQLPSAAAENKAMPPVESKPRKKHRAVSPTKSSRHRKPRRRKHRPAVACPASPLRGVYHPYRLHVLGTCRTVWGVVSSVRHESDGDYHVDVRPIGAASRALLDA